MQSKPFIYTAISEDDSNTAIPQVIADWNMIRYTTIKDNFPVTNETNAQTKFGTENSYPAYFPLESITEQFRDPGIVYPYLYDSYSASYPSDTLNDVKSVKFINTHLRESRRTDNRLYPRPYFAGRDNKFKYWISSAATLNVTDSNGRVAGQFSCTPVASSRALTVDLEFNTSVSSNKVTAKMNTHIGNPKTISISIKKSGTWTVVASGLDCPNNGVLEIWRPYIPGDVTTPGTWTTTPVYHTEETPNAITIDGIRIAVDKMERTTPSGVTTEAARNARLELIEFTPRLSIDLTKRVQSYELEYDIGTADGSGELIGTGTTNTGKVVISNDDGFFDTNTSQNLLTGKLDKNVEVSIDLIYQNISGTLAQRTVRQATMISDSWTVDGSDTATINLVDYSALLQFKKAQETFVERVPAYAAIWMLLDGIGMNRCDVKISTAAEDEYLIEWFWAKRDQTVWEIIQDIAKSFQLSVFFDEFGRLQIVTRKYLYDRNQDDPANTTADTIMYGEESAPKRSNIVDYNRVESSILNSASIKYSAVNEYNSNKSRNKILWHAEDPLVLGSADIIQSFSAGATQIKIDPDEETLFKFAGRFIIEDTGRVFEYDAKRYQLLDDSVRWVTGDDDMERTIEANNGVRPTFTGWIRLVGTAHGNFNSVVYELRNNWQCLKFAAGATSGQNDFSVLKYFNLDKDKNEGGSLCFTTAFVGGARYKVWKKSQNYDKYDRIGVKFKIVRGDDPEIGVVLFPQGTNGASGYHVSVTPDNAAGIPNVNVIRVSTTGNDTNIPIDYVNEYEGPRIQKGRWYYLEAIVWGEKGDWKVGVHLNGNYLGTWIDKTVNALDRSGNAQFFVKGSGRVLVDKFYVVNTGGKKHDRKPEYESIGRKDLLYNRKLCPGDKLFDQYIDDYLKGRFDARCWVYNFNSAGWGTAREIAHFRAKYDLPGIKQKIYCSNRSVKVSRFNRRPLGASFTIVNKSERPQLVQGSHETKVENAQRNESLFITSKGIQLQEPQTLEYSDKDSIRQYGESAYDLDGVWIQNRAAAVSLGRWMRDRLGTRSRAYDMEIYGNPLLQVGDIVSVTWTGRTIASYTYIVTKVSHNFSEGLETSISLKARNSTIPTRQVHIHDATIETDALVPPLFVQVGG